MRNVLCNKVITASVL